MYVPMNNPTRPIDAYDLYESFQSRAMLSKFDSKERDLWETAAEAVRDSPTLSPGDDLWDLFSEITCAYYGKEMYFKQDNGTVYSRSSCRYLTWEQAKSEFLTRLYHDLGDLC